MDKVRFGIIGIGNRGTEIAQRILNGETTELEITAVADTDPARLAWASENLPGVQRFDSAQALLDSGAVDAVVVAVPHYDHPGLCLEALKRNIHVMCEKPAGVYTKAVRPVIEYAKICPATFAMMFNQRTNCVYRKMKEIVASGALGQIRRVNWLITSWFRSQSYYDSGSWRATWAGEGGGVLLNQCPHNLDLLQWICGMPVRVRAFVHNGKWHDIEVEDDVTAYMEFENGATGTFITSTGDTPGDNRFEITLDGGTLICDGKALTLEKLKTPIPQFMREYKAGFGRPDCEVMPVETDGLNLQTAGVLNAFAAHILRGEPLVAEGAEGINGLTLSNAMHLSAWTDQMISLPLDEDLFLTELNKRRAVSRQKAPVQGSGMMDISQSR
ncbi:MAG: Gfo/Idh/MocA family oxidoreductase [Eubacteriales bacterium]|nr:Gfo/Idh/MocA family oxidoreductase [Eubacteriales bacterium]